MSGGAVKTSAGNRQQKLGGKSEAKMGGDSNLTEGDLPPATEDIKPDHVLRYDEVDGGR